MEAPRALACALALALLAPELIAHDMFGVSAVGLGDLDGDGKPDLAVGDPAHPVAGDWSGRVWLVSSATWRPLRVVDGTAADDQLGATLAAPGDLDGDGTDDVLVGATPGGCERPARVSAVSGATGAVLYTVELPAGDGMKVPWYSSSRGPALAVLGDADEDGVRDFLVGAPLDGTTAPLAGSVECRSGKTGEVLYWEPGAGAGDRLGSSVAAVGDLDGDGFPDAAVGATPEWDPESELVELREYRPGYVLVLSGKDGRAIRSLRAPEGSRRFGITVASAGDLDRDGRADVAVASCFWDFVPEPAGIGHAASRPPRVRAFSGADGALLRTWQLEAHEESFGAQILGLGDLDGDEVPDLLITAPSAFGCPTSLAVHSGAENRRVREQPSWAGEDILVGTHLGLNVARLADLDGDGHSEVAVGAASVRAGGSIPGQLFVYSPATGRELARLSREGLDGRPEESGR